MKKCIDNIADSISPLSECHWKLDRQMNAKTFDWTDMIYEQSFIFTGLKLIIVYDDKTQLKANLDWKSEM